MVCGCIVTKLKNTFDSLVCEFIAKAGKCAIGIFFRCRCNIFTIGNRSTVRSDCFSSSSICETFLVVFRFIRCPRQSPPYTDVAGLEIRIRSRHLRNDIVKKVRFSATGLFGRVQSYELAHEFSLCILLSALDKVVSINQSRLENQKKRIGNVLSWPT